MNKLSKENHKALFNVASRAQKADIRRFVDCCLDLKFCYEHTQLDFTKLLSFDNFNFSHDIAGIANNLNHDTHKLDNCFCPRCAL